MNRKTISTIIALAISAFFLWIVFRKIEFGVLFQTFRSINWIWLIPFIIISWISFWWRALRWQVLLEPYRKIPSWSLYGPLMIGFAFNSVFPARAGEFARPLALMKSEKVPVTTGLSTVVLERVADIIALLSLFALSFMFMEFDDSVARTWEATVSKGSTVHLYSNTTAIAIIVISLLLAGWLYKLSRKTEAGKKKLLFWSSMILCGLQVFVIAGWYFFTSRYEADEVYTFGQDVVLNAEKFQEIARGASVLAIIVISGSLMMISRKFRELVLAILASKWFPLPAIFKEKVIGIFESFAAGFDALRNPKLAGLVAVHTIIVWVMTGFSFWVMALGVPSLDLSILHAMVFLVITCIVISIPAAPGFWGLYELGGIVALILCGVVADTDEGNAIALGFTLVVHFFQWALVTIIGLYYAAKIHVSASDLDNTDESVESMQSEPTP